MREILFKAKRIDNGEWIEGLVTKIENTFCLIREYGSNISYECDVNTLCQYTGLNDKNGNKIWENDVVGYYSEYSECWNYGTVSYGEFNCSCCNGVYGWTFECEDIRDYKSYEVKGNIFDNPELIGGIDE
jgi:uncharacterized phage protein (TIGR01671 family)